LWDQWQGKAFATDGGRQAPWTTAGRAVIAADGDMARVATTFEIIGERNTSDPAVLHDFLAWTMQTRPASRYSVAMWDHGGGLSGVCFDDETGFNSITVKELARAVSDSGMGPAVLMYDACLMANVEQFYELSGVPPVQVASGEVINGSGFDYRTAFSKLDSSPDNVTPAGRQLRGHGGGRHGDEGVRRLDRGFLREPVVAAAGPGRPGDAVRVPAVRRTAAVSGCRSPAGLRAITRHG